MQAKLNLPMLCEHHNVPFLEGGKHHHCVEGWIQLHCPCCSDGTSGWHLGYSTESGAWNCWRCGKQSTAKVLSSLLPNVPLQQLFSQFAKHRTSLAERPIVKKEERKRVKPPPNMRNSLGPAHRKYLWSRGFDVKKLVDKWGLGSTASTSGLWNWRIVIPVHDVTGRLVSYIGRAISSKNSLRYLSLSEEDSIITPKNMLYGEQFIGGSTVVVMEGPTDVWRFGSGAVCTFGTSWTREQAARLRRFHRCVIMYDPSMPAQIQAEKLATWLSGSVDIVEIVDTESNDPGSLSLDEVRNLRLELAI